MLPTAETAKVESTRLPLHARPLMLVLAPEKYSSDFFGSVPVMLTAAAPVAAGVATRSLKRMSSGIMPATPLMFDAPRMVSPPVKEHDVKRRATVDRANRAIWATSIVMAALKAVPVHVIPVRAHSLPSVRISALVPPEYVHAAETEYGAARARSNKAVTNESTADGTARCDMR